MTRAHCLPPVPAFCSLASFVTLSYSLDINHNATGSLKDTTANLKNGQGFTVNIISEAFVENANATAVDAPPNFDEWALSGLTKEKCIAPFASQLVAQCGASNKEPRYDSNKLEAVSTTLLIPLVS
ncbi:uncharacterized protein F5891DRAFT_1180250 [Suillus fuscotomentosus]|uniref:Uncharacterized protein n=1 Tax=Suillus fuscotomentosus TaxID=1912939 RepID=A0AAD4HUN2_9AGAM|nr:uncharacterized protein F5891DRAFT_1180250 [Suillus fuscotomentosus]KAG1908711.1 hypothetical protein F5891DRAFT_1180250 [Suillus fuscotomentosus]